MWPFYQPWKPSMSRSWTSSQDTDSRLTKNASSNSNSVVNPEKHSCILQSAERFVVLSQLHPHSSVSGLPTTSKLAPVQHACHDVFAMRSPKLGDLIITGLPIATAFCQCSRCLWTRLLSTTNCQRSRKLGPLCWPTCSWKRRIVRGTWKTPSGSQR